MKKYLAYGWLLLTTAAVFTFIFIQRSTYYESLSCTGACNVAQILSALIALVGLIVLPFFLDDEKRTVIIGHVVLLALWVMTYFGVLLPARPL